MTTPRSYQTEAIIIKKTKLGEADSILTFYTPYMGKIQGFARSLRKPKSRLAGHLELLTYSQVSLARGRSIDTITGSQTINSFLPLKTDLDLASYALYVIELVNQFTPEHAEDYPLFRLLLETMERLCSPEQNRELVLRYFELHLLEKAGYRPQLHHCVSCRTALEPVVNTFSPASGGILCPVCGRDHFSIYSVSVNALKVLRLMQSTGYETVCRLRMNPELSRELEMLLRNYLRYLLEREVKSAAWLDSLRSEAGRTQAEA